MIRQSVNPRKLGTLAGIGLIVGMVAGVYVIAFAAELAARLIPFARANVVIWLLGVLIAFGVMRRFLQGFRYTFHEDMFYVERLFGQQSRMLMKLPAKDLVDVGEKSRLLTDDQRITERMICARCDVPRKVLAYRQEEQIRLMELHMDEELFAALEKACQENRKEK